MTPEQIDAYNWRDHDDIVHLVYAFEREAPYMRGEGEGDVDYEHWTEYVTACETRVGDGEPVYIKDALTCVTCLAEEGVHG